MLALLRRESFWPPSIFYISVIITHTLQITFLHDIDLLWAAFMYCINTCLSDLWVLLHGCCTSVFFVVMFHFLLVSSLFTCWRTIILVYSLHLSSLTCCVFNCCHQRWKIEGLVKSTYEVWTYRYMNVKKILKHFK